MASQWFSKGLYHFSLGDVAWVSQDIRAMLMRSTYTFDDADEFVSDLGSTDNGRLGATLANKTSTGAGILNADDCVITATAAVATNAVIVYKYNAADASALLLLYIDNFTGLPFTPAASQNVSVGWGNGANLIARL